MALIDCPECAQKISDQAFACPHCGYPMKEKETRRGKREFPLLDPLAEVAAMAEEFAGALRQALGGEKREEAKRKGPEEKGENKPPQ